VLKVNEELVKKSILLIFREGKTLTWESQSPGSCTKKAGLTEQTGLMILIKVV
jgi:hypothetical protein